MKKHIRKFNKIISKLKYNKIVKRWKTRQKENVKKIEGKER